MIVPAKLRMETAIAMSLKPTGKMFPSIVDDIDRGACPDCQNMVDYGLIKHDELSVKEYRISGLCGPCQDHVFTPEVNEHDHDATALVPERHGLFT